MFEIKNIGSYFETDQENFLIPNNAQPNHDWLNIANEYTEKVIALFPNLFKAIYLRGSVVTNNAIDNISDLDIVLIFYSKPQKNVIVQLEEIANKENGQYPFIARYDLNIHIYPHILRNKENTHLKLGSILLYGEDFLDEVPKKHPGQDVWVQLNTLKEETEKIRRNTYEHELSNVKTIDTCKWYMKRILRSGMELVSGEEQRYTRDLYRCWESFSKYHPKMKDEMYKVLNLAINPVSDINIIQKYIPVAEYILENKNHQSRKTGDIL